MNRVITISLNGNAFQLEEAGYETLRRYLDTAVARLRDNPDREEIVSDLEQAIADKCGRFLAPHKSVISAAEIARILDEMGPVDAPATDDGPSAQAFDGRTHARPDGAPKRLYQIHEGAMISGVCNGFAAYLNVDVTIVRIIFVLLTILSGGLGIIVYLVMMFVIPYATTSEERAAAHGQPFSASELIERAKKQYEEFRNRHDWRRSQAHWRSHWRAQRRHWREQQRAWRQRWRYDWDSSGRSHWQSPPPPPRPVSYGTRVFAGFMIPIFAILSAAIFVVWLVVLISLASTGTIFGWHLPYSIPVWAALLFVVLVYGAVAGPLRAASRASRHAATGRTYGWYGFGDALVRLGFILMFLWLAYHFIPGVADLVNGLPDLWRHVTHEAQTTAMNWWRS